jgi:aspartyl-tRNA(Asn)/glutamyl-tRNA(Gln) amidotransferase subunit A
MSSALQAGTYSSVELTSAHLVDIEQRNSDSNSFISVTRDAALEQASKADKLRADGQQTPLTGIPIAHKDIFCTEGILTTCGSKMLSNFVAPYNATMVQIKCRRRYYLG